METRYPAITEKKIFLNHENLALKSQGPTRRRKIFRKLKAQNILTFTDAWGEYSCQIWSPIIYAQKKYPTIKERNILEELKYLNISAGYLVNKVFYI